MNRKVLYIEQDNESLADSIIYESQEQIERVLEGEQAGVKTIGIYQLVDTVVVKRVSKYEWNSTSPKAG